MYAVFEYKGMHPLMTIVAQHHPEPWVPAVLNRLNVTFAQQHSGRPRPRSPSCVVAKRHEMSIADFGKAWSAYTKGKHHAFVVGEAGVSISARRSGTRSGRPSAT